MKVILEYEPNTGYIKDVNGVIVSTWLGLQHFEAEDTQTQESISVKDTLLLTKYSADDLVKLREAGVI